MDDHVSFAMPPDSTHADTIKRLAAETHHRIEGVLPEVLSQSADPRGQVIFGSARSAVMQILDNHLDVCWNESGDDIWRFEVREARVELSPFDELVGRMLAAGESREHLAAELDRRGFQPIEWLEEAARNRLADHNQKRSRQAIHTFSDAVKRRKPLRWTVTKISRRGKRPVISGKTLELRAAVLKRFRRAREKWNRAHPGKV